jgi:hypothetical protein
MNDRRGNRRVTTTDEHGIVSARVRAGVDVAVIDASADSVLVEGRQRFVPNTTLDLQLSTNTEQVTMKGRVTRSQVSRLGASVVWYRGAIRFDRHLPWMMTTAGDSWRESALPGAELRPVGRERGPATHARSGR